ncbi:MAG TPA: hypothetical protein VHV83_06750 [Armatimonadota bacterium]|nr:hypothetical protein [Armatimonadota bacterium]
MLNRVEYGGWANNIKLSNGQIELIATLDVGPRIIRLGFVDGPNLMKEFPEEMGGTGENEWMIRGGHRFWHAPEAKPRSYVQDNFPVALEEIDELGIRLTPRPEVDNGIQKQLEIRMAADRNSVTLTHRMTNIGPWAITAAPWALSVMTPGGMAIIPLPEKRPHTEVLVPDFPLVMWPYTDMSDSRFTWGRRYITLKQDAAKGPTKLGTALHLGWAAYLVHNTLFTKYFDYQPGEQYPDYGCNFETFTNEFMLEIESVAPLRLLEPGMTVEHVETWRLCANIPEISDEASIDQLIRPLVDAQ